MADSKISELTAITGANTADDDLLVIVDTSASQTKKITLGELENALAERDFNFGDNDKLTFGAGSDLQIYHDGSNSIIKDNGAGDLRIMGSDDVRIVDAVNEENMARFNRDGAVTLYYDNAAKIATTSTGIDVTGTVTADGLTVDGASNITKTSAASEAMPFVVQNQDSSTSTAVAIGFANTSLADQTTSNTKIGVIRTNSVTSGDTDLYINTQALGGSLRRALFSSTGDISFYEDTGTTAKFFWDASAESLGIGTSSPSTTLDVSGAIRSTDRISADGTEAAPAFRFTTDTNTGMFPPSGGDAIGFSTNGTERMRITSSGSVGIGTSSPARPLDVNGTARLSDGSALEWGGITTRVSGSSSTNTLILSTNNTERMRIDSSGNVDIGSTGGGVKLSVAGAIGPQNGSAASPTHTFYSDTNTGMFRAAVDTLGFSTAGSERMRIDSSGNLLIGTTSPTSAGEEGIALSAGSYGGYIAARRASGNPLTLDRRTNNGDIAIFQKDGTKVGSIGVASGNNLYISSSDGDHAGLEFSFNCVIPQRGGTLADNIVDLGATSYRFDDIFATNALIQTSDQNEKQDIAELSEAEQRVAVAAKGLLRKFRWKDAVAKKGDEARTHFGIIAQDLQAAFAAEGLDAGDYAMFIHTTWTDEETGEERSRMGVRYSELLAFIIAAI